MHISFLTPEYPSPKTGSSGGLGTSIFNLAQSLTAKGVNVTIFVYGQDNDEYYHDSGIHFYRIKNVRFKGLSWWLTRKKIEKLINQAIQDHKIDILEVADWTGISAWMKINCPVVMRLHGSDTYFCHLDKRPVKWWNNIQERTAFKQARAIIAVSDFVGSLTNQLFHSNRKYEVIPNSVDTEKFISKTTQEDPNMILYFGTLIRKKGVLDIPHYFNKVLEKHPEAKLLLVGGDSADIQTGGFSTWELMLPQFSAQAKQRVEYLGKKPYSEIQGYIEKAAVCIFPSYAEALPVSWLEAMAMGKAIVASNIGWATEMLTHEQDALLCHPSQHQTFATNIVLLLQNVELMKILGSNASKRVENAFDNRLIAKQNIKYYRSVMNEYT
ncbi:glycosyltransferase family 4 protein [Cecembia rubra]|uniref:Glycosyltransferase involved in cell wall biosynthesis n=1 Tax=Cecembia rubra TaxID=1485585 RepID=A0A2P8E3C4_9BACT|nr:glycosyltransferase family 4 protein [Cecembia rubra]PSL03956.1 glycosyltransferase involved in cell wall biosynthesis [Cecembia rubra]